MVRPPETESTWPVMKAASSLARKQGGAGAAGADDVAVRIGMKVKVVFKPTDGGPPVPMFTPT